MAAPSSIKCLDLLLLLSAVFLISSVSGKLDCEDLPIDLCAYAVSSGGARCVLEKLVLSPGQALFQCQASSVEATSFAEWIETNECVTSCGLQRMSVGLSSDTLIESKSLKGLCSDKCQHNCPNLVDLYTKLAAGEGVDLSHTCKAQQNLSSRRIMIDGRGLLASVSKSEFTAPSPQESLSLELLPPVESPLPF